MWRTGIKTCCHVRTGAALRRWVSPELLRDFECVNGALDAPDKPLAVGAPLLDGEHVLVWAQVAGHPAWPATLALVPPDAAGDAQLAAQMCKEEHFLLGMQSTSTARPNAAVMELC